MSNLVQPLVDFLKQYKRIINVDVYDNVCWYYSDHDNELAINTDDDEDDLLNSDGDTYSFFARIKYESDDGYVVFVDVDNGCGTTNTIIVSKHMEVVL